MKRQYIAGFAVGLMILLSGCSDTPAPPADTSAADLKALRDGEVTWNSDWASKDGGKILGHYASDASLMISDSPLVKGTDGIRTALAAMLADKNLSLTFTTSSADVSKDIGYTQGTYTMTMTNPKTKKPVTEKGKYVTVYKRQTDGSWKAVADIANADAPAVAAPVASKARKSAPAAKKKKR